MNVRPARTPLLNLCIDYLRGVVRWTLREMVGRDG
jgi:hypothetical protein